MSQANNPNTTPAIQFDPDADFINAANRARDAWSESFRLRDQDGPDDEISRLQSEADDIQRERLAIGDVHTERGFAELCRVIVEADLEGSRTGGREFARACYHLGRMAERIGITEMPELFDDGEANIAPIADARASRGGLIADIRRTERPPPAAAFFICTTKSA